MWSLFMPTNNPRVNITFEKSMAGLLADLAKQEDRSVSSLAKELILEALERREDKALSLLAEKRDKPKAKRIKDEDVWK